MQLSDQRSAVSGDDGRVSVGTLSRVIKLYQELYKLPYIDLYYIV